MSRIGRLTVAFIFVFVFTVSAAGEEQKTFKAGTARVDITPRHFPVVVNGGFYPQFVEEVQDPLYARCLALDDGDERIVLVVIDNCFLPTDLVVKIKKLVTEKTGVPGDRTMISATHCHSAPSLGGGHASPIDEPYLAFLPDKVAETVETALANLEPAKIGWAVGNDPNNIYCRRFLMKKGTAMTNPFSDKRDDRAMMNPGHANPNKIARTGPVDTAVSVISVMTRDDRALAVFANYSTHYAGVRGGVISGDYFGVFAEEIRRLISEKIGADQISDRFVGIMSNGTSGDANCIDFLNPKRRFDYRSVGKETAAAAMAVWPNIQYFDRVPLGIMEKRIVLTNRVPTAEEVRAAREHVANLPDGKPKTIPDAYALAVVAMENHPKTSEIPLQVARIGELGITALPGEFYGITGLEIKARSPFSVTVNIGLANGCFGYVIPPEQHRLGGYNSWRTQFSCLEVDAETKIRQTVIEILRTLNSAD